MNWNDNINTQNGHKVKLADFVKGYGTVDALKVLGASVYDIEYNNPENADMTVVIDTPIVHTDFVFSFYVLLIGEPEDEDSSGSVELFDGVGAEDYSIIHTNAVYNCDSIELDTYQNTDAVRCVRIKYKANENAPAHIKGKLIAFQADLRGGE